MSIVHDPHGDLGAGRILSIDKPLRWTSFDVVKRLKYQLLQEILSSTEDAQEKKAIRKKLKVGHAGTLDPLATGLLILCTGKMTKRIDEIQGQEKEYTGTLVLGAVTPTYDLESEPEQFSPWEVISEDQLKATATTFEGWIEQVPPAHSAIRLGGERAYDLARKGIEVVLKSRRIEIKSFTLTRINGPEVDFRVVCSKGTYIRSLAHDFGQRLGCGAYLSALRRTRIGTFSVEEAVEIPSKTY